MGKVVVSPDISVLDFSVLLDISGSTPVATLENASTQANPSNLDWVFELYSPSGTPIYKGNFDTPDADNGWEDPFVINSGFPKPYNQIEWSGNTYIAKVKVKDSNGTIFEFEKSFKVCRPNGNDKNSKNTFGVSSVEIKSLCSKAQLWVEDKTNYGYQGFTGTIVSKVFKLYYPADETGDEPAPTTVNNFNSVLLSISQSGSGYRYFVSSVFDYDLGDNITVRVKYLKQDSFTIYCHLDITPIACELQKLTDSIVNGSCDDAAKAQEIMNKVTPKLLTAMIGIQYPQSGIDPFKIVEEINEIAGWQCDCCPNGVVPLAAVAANDLAFVVNGSGDIEGDFSVAGSTVTLNIGDKIYVFELCEGIPSSAFSITPSTTENTKSFCFNVNVDTLTEEILAKIGSSTTFKNTLNSFINTNSGQWKMNVDMKCILPNQNSCDYTFTTPDISALSEVLIKRISFSDGRPNVNVNFIFDLTNAAALETLLSQLFSEETVNVSYLAGILTIEFEGTALPISAIEYFNGTNDLSMILTKDCSSSTSIDANVFGQSLVDWVCGLILSQVKAGKVFVIKKLSGVGGSVTEITLGSTANASAVLSTILNEYNNLVDIVKEIKEATCENLQQVYQEPEENVTVESSDLIHGQIAGACAPIKIKDLAVLINQMAQTNQDVKTEFCKAASACGTPVCPPVASMDVTYDSGTQTLQAIIQNTGALKYLVGYYVTNSGRTTLQGLQEVPAEAGVTTTVSWANVPPANYTVMVRAFCANGQSEDFTSDALGCQKPISFNVTFDNADQEFDVVFDTPVGITKIRLDIQYPNGGNSSTVHLVAGGPFSVARPAGIFGIFTFRLRSVCDEDNGWVSEPIGPVSLDVPEVKSCPIVTNVQVSNIGANSMTVTATKPVGSNVGAFKLRLTNQTSGAVSEYIANTPGATVTWNVTGLNDNTVYAIEVITLCTDVTGSGESLPVSGGEVLTQGAGANNSSIVNNSVSAVCSSFVVKVNGAVVHSGGPLAAGGGSSPFTIGDIAGASIEVLFFGVNVDAGSGAIESNSVNYNADVLDFNTIQWNSVDIVNGMIIEIAGD